MSAFLAPHFFLPFVCEHLRALGYEAEVETASRPSVSWAGSDVGHIALKRGPTERLAVTSPGLSSMRPSNWSHTTSIGRIPISARRVLPLEYHFLLRFSGLLSRDTFKARFRGRAKGPSWSGGRLAELLATDAALAEALDAELKPHERLSVRADPRRWLVRIVCETSIRGGFAVLPTPKIEIESGLPSRELIEAIGRVADHARAFL
jgi:hypothetical protein